MFTPHNCKSFASYNAELYTQKINSMSERDSIDFGKTDISRLFVKIFLPTLASLMFGASVYVADGMSQITSHIVFI